MKHRCCIMWFRNDLRLHDNPALARAARSAEYLVAVYVDDPRDSAPTDSGVPRMGAHRRRFLDESLADLSNSLAKSGSSLVVLRGEAETVIPQLAATCGATCVVAAEEAGLYEVERDSALEKRLKAQGCTLHLEWSSTLVHPDDIPFDVDRVPDVFTVFRKKVESAWVVRPTVPVPALPPPPPDLLASPPSHISEIAAPPRFRGGETEALRRLHYYLWDADLLREYKETRNGMLGDDYSSKFSPWLANGCLSPRYVYEEVTRYERERTKNESTYWLVFELLWRDYFKYVALKHGASLFALSGVMNVKKKWNRNEELFRTWQEGNTGIPLVDANMRELARTGFMSNRGRQNVASFFVHDLGLDWRLGAEWFESMLVDYDVASNWGNWQYVAGVGNDPRARRFNIRRQSEMYDSDGRYVRFWMPELEGVPRKYSHTPWEYDKKWKTVVKLPEGE